MSINVLLMAFFIIKKGRKKSIWANFRNAPAEQQISLQTDVSDAFFHTDYLLCGCLFNSF